jgi:NAD-dependent dihydropyrimidine dehydrogenase PreA subunit
MVYVDEKLCTGCGLCLDACARGAISIVGQTASVDDRLCTACGRCVDICMTDAIVLIETVEPEPAAPVQTPRAPARQRNMETVSPALRAASAAPVPGASRIASLERMLSGVFSFAALAFDLKQRASAERRPRSMGGPGQGGRGRGRRRCQDGRPRGGR